jgi:hypothetical protein
LHVATIKMLEIISVQNYKCNLQILRKKARFPMLFLLIGDLSTCK